MPGIERIRSSFRDPSGFVFVHDGRLYRQVNRSYQAHYEQLMGGGLYDELVERGLLVAHAEVDRLPSQDADSFKTLQPQRVPFISYPYEWSFSQLKDAAQATLAIQRRALARGMSLKDASAYNIQFVDGKPRLIDTLSFEPYQEGRAWVAYRQFCQHFLAPLALMSHKDIRLSQLSRVYMDGIPLDLAAALLPRRASLNLGLLTHLRLHARAQTRYSAKPGAAQNSRQLSKDGLLNIIDNLRATIRGLRWKAGGTAWADYYDGDSYRESGFTHKEQLVGEVLDIIRPGEVWDLGANTGHFSRLASQRGALAVSMDSDASVVEVNYRRAKRERDAKLHPLLIDLTNPSGGIGWASEERDSLADRSQADCVMALALLHHLAISSNLPLAMIADFFASLAEWLIIEFVPKSDKKVHTLLASREDIFADYTQAGFEQAFAKLFEIVRSQQIDDSERSLYLLRRR